MSVTLLIQNAPGAEVDLQVGLHGRGRSESPPLARGTEGAAPVGPVSSVQTLALGLAICKGNF